MSPVAASDIYPAVRRFLLECGLQKTLKAFDKETATGEEADAAPAKSKKAKALAELELTEACQVWLDARGGSAAAPAAEANGAAPNGAADQEPAKQKKKKKQEAEAEPEAAQAAEEPVVEAPKKKRKHEAEEEPAAEAAAEEDAEVDVPKKKKNKKNEDKKPGVPFQRIDDAKWRATLKEDRFIDNTHQAKQKFGGSAGDSWGDAAAEDLLKVKGKGFRKEMAKKKRSSWRGGGEIDQGCNSVKFQDSSDEE
mmetsp:Transcript_40260/g.108782  ORF Transcript_40260/g.108782 Transcript_40260/m.108782 type:complete len:252 (-) Transcript_40260:135-890(-)